MSKINTEDCFKIHPDAVYTFIDHEAIIISNIDEGLFGLNEIASELLKQLEHSPSSIKTLSKYLLEYYDVNEEQCLSDVKKLIESLLEKHLIIQITQ